MAVHLSVYLSWSNSFCADFLSSYLCAVPRGCDEGISDRVNGSYRAGGGATSGPEVFSRLRTRDGLFMTLDLRKRAGIDLDFLDLATIEVILVLVVAKVLVVLGQGRRICCSSLGYIN